MKKLTIRISDEEHAHLDRYCDEMGKSQNDVIRQCIAALDPNERDRLTRIEQAIADLVKVTAVLADRAKYRDEKMESSIDALRRAMELLTQTRLDAIVEQLKKQDGDREGD